jgi:multiple sugar transport system permease protein
MTTTATPMKPARTAPRPPQRRPSPARILLYVALVAGAAVMVYPLVWMFFASLKPADEIFATSWLLPTRWLPENYSIGWAGVGDVSFGRFFANSMLVAVGAVVGNAIACSMAAYAFARLEFPGKRLAFVAMMATMMMPAQVTIIPHYVIFQSWGWVNTYWPLVLPKFLAVDAFFIFLIVQFVRGLPRELDDAAEIDGCNRGQVFLRIILPLLRPALVTTAIFTFLWTYNDFFSPLIYLSQTALYTVPLALRQFLDTSGESQWGPMFAMSTLSIVPSLVLFVLFQRQIVDGVATTGMKG